MSGLALSPSPEEIHNTSPPSRPPRPRSPLSAGQHSTEQSPATDVFGDAFSLEPLDSFGNPDLLLNRHEQPDHSSSSSSSTLEDEHGGLSLYQSPFRDSVASLQVQMSQRSDSPQPESDPPQPEQPSLNRMSNASNVSNNAITSSVTRQLSSASSTSHPPSSVAHRSISISSRFSMPRALSPYTGQTRPTHPYAMYPQATGLGRSTSNSSTSTVRPVERTNVDSVPPQHPYSLYPQNTVPEEEDVEAHSIPVGFPGHGQAFQPQNQTADEVGDIVSPDGHAEQLPPYTRYPDGLPQKFGAHEYSSTSPEEVLVTMPVPTESGVSSRTLLDENGPEQEGAASSQPQADDPSGTIKETLMEKGKRRVCCNVQIWTIVLMAIVVLIGAVIGGIVGGVVGNKRGERAGGASVSSALGTTRPTSVFVTVTATTILDAAHLTATPSLLPIPTGKFNIPASSLYRSSSSCVTDADLATSWQCMAQGSFPCLLTEESDGSKNLQLESYRRSGSFVYGAQAPSLVDTVFDLKLMLDKTEPELGPALFFFTPFDKLVIIPESNFPQVPSGQAVNGPQLLRRAQETVPLMSKPSDRPYFCWWNSTYLELFIYVNQPIKHSMTMGSSTDPNYSAFSHTATTLATATPAPSKGHRSLHQRSSHLEPRGDPPMEYPRRIKLEEKRSSVDGIPPYCEQMQVMDDGSISGPLGSRVPVDETETTLSSKAKFDVLSRKQSLLEEIRKDYDENKVCVCQWSHR
ncbi:hypothetical protein GX48_00250 [Paracoccidioides brasiliensis]|nr:hypothetical protein GX48_00250 [Paracoccidioides brasiliensis]